MSVQEVNAVNVPGKTNAASRGMFDQDTFLKLLVAQLKNPSPFEPPNTDRMMDQAVQFGMLERLVKMEDAVREMSRLFHLSRAAEMVGREVVVRDGDRLIQGTVERVLFREESALVVIDQGNYKIDQVVEVR